MVTVIHPRDPTVLWKSETFYWETQDQIQVDRELQGEQMTRTKLDQVYKVKRVPKQTTFSLVFPIRTQGWAEFISAEDGRGR